MARVSPLPKVDSQINADQYRLIAILLALSKVYERLVLNQILEFIEQNHIFTESMTGYRKGHFTTTFLQQIRDDIIRAMKKVKSLSLLLLISPKRLTPLTIQRF